MVAKTCSSYAIARVVVVYGKALKGQHGNIVQLVKNRLEAGQEIRVVSDQYRTPTWVQDIAEGIKLLLDSKNGIYHICGKEYMNNDIQLLLLDGIGLERSLQVCLSFRERSDLYSR